MSQKKEAPQVETPVERHQRFRVEASRETVESIVVAIILALLFRAFVAEAFVIPTGSMAPALMGAHKDLTCPECGQPYRTGASYETKDVPQRNTIVASVCPNCRHVNSLDLAGDPDQGTFNGDRILVSKFPYALGDPDRWDVIVFKFPGNPKQNYIKRLVGLPKETLMIRFGDVFARPQDGNDFEILRKPHDKLMAMAHHVYDTEHQPRALVAADYPSRWQPWQPGATTPPQDSWQITRSENQWQAKLGTVSDSLQMMRYYHRIPTDEQWNRAHQGLSLANVDPYSSLGITDFYGYDAYGFVNSNQVWDTEPGKLPPDGLVQKLLSRFRLTPGVYRKDYESGGDLAQFSYGVQFGQTGRTRFGSHWVGDLIVEADVQADSETGEIVLELVESAMIFRCRIDVATGQAKLEIIDLDHPITFAEAGGAATAEPTAETSVRGGQTHQLRFANCDDKLYLWVDDSPIEFDQPTTFDMSQVRVLAEQRPVTDATHPLDAAPVAVGAQGTTATVNRIRILRDKYYIATKDTAGGLLDYNLSRANFNNLIDSQGNRVSDFQVAIAEPSLWEQHGLWNARRSVQFVLDEDQFFPMGDNSPESQDARCWVESLPTQAGVDPDAYRFANAHYVPRDLLVGKALIVFWPHYWHEPVPFTPNFSRMRLIR